MEEIGRQNQIFGLYWICPNRFRFSHRFSFSVRCSKRRHSNPQDTINFGCSRRRSQQTPKLRQLIKTLPMISISTYHWTITECKVKFWIFYEFWKSFKVWVWYWYWDISNGLIVLFDLDDEKLKRKLDMIMYDKGIRFWVQRIVVCPCCIRCRQRIQVDWPWTFQAPHWCWYRFWNVGRALGILDSSTTQQLHSC